MAKKLSPEAKLIMGCAEDTLFLRHIRRPRKSVHRDCKRIFERENLAHKKHVQAVERGRKAAITRKWKSNPDVNMTAEQRDAINEKIANLIAHGLNSNEIANLYLRRITKGQLVRVIKDYQAH